MSVEMGRRVLEDLIRTLQKPAGGNVKTCLVPPPCTAVSTTAEADWGFQFAALYFRQNGLHSSAQLGGGHGRGMFRSVLGEGEKSSMSDTD